MISDVVAVDNFFTSQKTNVKDLIGKPNFEVIRHDITKEFFIEVDQVTSAAAAGVALSARDALCRRESQRTAARVPSARLPSVHAPLSPATAAAIARKAARGRRRGAPRAAPCRFTTWRAPRRRCTTSTTR